MMSMTSSKVYDSNGVELTWLMHLYVHPLLKKSIHITAVGYDYTDFPVVPQQASSLTYIFQKAPPRSSQILAPLIS